MIQEPKMPCTQLVTFAERELAAFIRSVTELFGVQQARAATEDWLEAVALLDCDLPRSSNSWRLITIAATTRFVRRLITQRKLRPYAPGATQDPSEPNHGRGAGALSVTRMLDTAEIREPNCENLLQSTKFLEGKTYAPESIANTLPQGSERL